jgi:hypothetical protein
MRNLSHAGCQLASPRMPWLLVCVCLVSCVGCFTKKPSAYRINPIVFARPIVPTVLSDGPLEPPPDIPLDFSKTPPRLAPSRTGPARPKVATVPPPEPVDTEKPEEPLIVPELPPAQLNAAKSDAQHSLDAAETNLSQLKGKKLNATQLDVVSKVRGFMDSSREAMKTSDWVRAKNLAKKAEVLSQELMANLK